MAAMEMVTFRAPRADRAALAEIAARDGRTLSQEIRWLVRMRVEADRVSHQQNGPAESASRGMAEPSEAIAASEDRGDRDGS
jgi:hypothetical protein